MCNEVLSPDLNDWGEPLLFDDSESDFDMANDNVPLPGAGVRRVLFPPDASDGVAPGAGAGAGAGAGPGTGIVIEADPVVMYGVAAGHAWVAAATAAEPGDAAVVSSVGLARDPEVSPSDVLRSTEWVAPAEAGAGVVVAVNMVTKVDDKIGLSIQWCTLSGHGPWPAFGEALRARMAHHGGLATQVKVAATFTKHQCLRCVDKEDKCDHCDRCPDGVLCLDGDPDFGAGVDTEVGMRHAVRTLALAVCMADLGSVGLDPFRAQGQHLDSVLALTSGPFLETNPAALYMTITITVV